MQGQSGVSLTFNTDANTKFDNFAGLNSLPVKGLVRVEGQTAQDGSLLAREVELLSAEAQGEDHGNREELQGIVTATIGAPVSSLMLLMHDGSGFKMAASNRGHLSLSQNCHNFVARFTGAAIKTLQELPPMVTDYFGVPQGLFCYCSRQHTWAKVLTFGRRGESCERERA